MDNLSDNPSLNVGQTLGVLIFLAFALIIGVADGVIKAVKKKLNALSTYTNRNRQ